MPYLPCRALLQVRTLPFPNLSSSRPASRAPRPTRRRRLRAMPAIPANPVPPPSPAPRASDSPTATAFTSPTHLRALKSKHQRLAPRLLQLPGAPRPPRPRRGRWRPRKTIHEGRMKRMANDLWIFNLYHVSMTSGDVSCLATIPSDVEATATFIAKADGVIAGISLADMIFNQVDPSLKVEWFESDGNYVHKGLQFGKIYGKMHRMCGIATLTKAMSDAARPACILETRKTAPGLRLIDKWPVETRTIEEMEDLLMYAAENNTSLTRIMLDNMVVPLANGDVDVSMLKDAVQLINGRFETEASGNVTVDTVKKIGESGVTYISSGALTHSLKAVDISLKIDTELALQVGRRTNRA
ncbi:Nicotinate-nucleotide pyrophosphorylase [carboxylating], chloroplastic [Zea mays]|uniref:Nicotinate-nucleotide pyrophosphorylase [carboxylating], chloroplastic n=1 Tax=Zea mays TaxID=4577 RepID=A0A3L6DV70_MAIZE|nr:Nicotinate-nucleotide pyrophosphorylase [carboxylating], chloroplastic [Zea mays]